MYLAQQLEEVREGTNRGYRLIRYRVATRADGRPIWKLHAPHGTWWASYHDPRFLEGARNRAKRWVRENAKHIPIISAAAPGKLVSMSEAERLTGCKRPAALDFLRERVEESNTAAIENYVKLPKVKPPKPEPEKPAPPTPAEVAREKMARAQARLNEWDRRAAHAAKKQNEWTRKVNHYRRRAESLESPRREKSP